MITPDNNTPETARTTDATEQTGLEPVETGHDESAGTADAPRETAPAEPGRYCTWAVISILMAVVAWIAANWNGYAAMGASVVSLVFGFMALRSRRHGVRNTAITSIIAAAVLLVVLTAFVMVIYLGLKAI